MTLLACTPTISNYSQLKNDTGGFYVVPNVDFTGYTLKYLIKKNASDNDSAAIKTLTPTFQTINGAVCIVVAFGVSDLTDISVGDYAHAVKVISSDESVDLTLVIGTLSVKQNYINYPEGS